MASGISLLTTILNLQQRQQEHQDQLAYQQWRQQYEAEKLAIDTEQFKREMEWNEKKFGLTEREIDTRLKELNDRIAAREQERKYKEEKQARDKKTRAGMVKLIPDLTGESGPTKSNAGWEDIFNNAPVEQSLPLLKDMRDAMQKWNEPQHYQIKEDSDGNMYATFFDLQTGKTVVQDIDKDAPLPDSLKSDVFLARLQAKAEQAAQGYGEPLTRPEQILLDQGMAEKLLKLSKIGNGTYTKDGEERTVIERFTFDKAGLSARETLAEYGKEIERKDRLAEAASKDLMNTEGIIGKMEAAMSQYEHLVGAGLDPLGVPGKVEMFFHDIASKIRGETPESLANLISDNPSDPRRQLVSQAFGFVSNAWGNFNEYRKWVTGVAAGFKELEWLLKAFANPEDSGLKFVGKTVGLLKVLDIQRRHMLAYGALNPSKNIYETDDKGNPVTFSKGYRDFLRRVSLDEQFDSDYNQQTYAKMLAQEVDAKRMTQEEAVRILENVFPNQR